MTGLYPCGHNRGGDNDQWFKNGSRQSSRCRQCNVDDVNARGKAGRDALRTLQSIPLLDATAWIVPKGLADMPAKPGIESYEYVECLVLYNGRLLLRPWNCEHLVFDDEQHDDFFCDWSDVSAYRPLTEDRQLASAAVAASEGPSA